MGGKALKKVFTKRLPAAEYKLVMAEVLTILEGYFKTYAVPSTIGEKEDYGDLDVVVAVDDDEAMLAALKDIELEFKSKEVYHNGPVHSFEFREFQVDLIVVPRAEYFMQLHYLSYGDLGGMVGRFANKHGMKFGGSGLQLQIRTDSRDPTTTHTLLHLSADFHAILDFLGFDSKRFHNGFECELDVFEFVSTSRLFSPSLFLSLNHDYRRRSVKRPMFIRFMKYLEQRGLLSLPKDEDGEEEGEGEGEEGCEDGVQHGERGLTLLGEQALIVFNKQAAFNELMEAKAKNDREKSLVKRVVPYCTALGLSGKRLGTLLEAIRQSESAMNALQAAADAEEDVTSMGPTEAVTAGAASDEKPFENAVKKLLAELSVA
eukprot:GILJ01004898.1.p1 GENE.GILJ01004898.1~~GILJ01004898.1.p1  ORF type:complete len:375 (-),score=73.71 GILJ01004898.1:195-1319(-)